MSILCCSLLGCFFVDQPPGQKNSPRGVVVVVIMVVVVVAVVVIVVAVAVVTPEGT